MISDNPNYILYQTTMISLTQILFLTLLVSSSLSAKLMNANKAQAQAKEQENLKHVVESNHYFSDKQQQTTYNINKVQTDMALIVVLKDSGEQQKSQASVQFTLDSGSASATCQMKNNQSLCVLNKVTTTDVKLKIKCDRLPCEASWSVFQSTSKEAQTMQDFKDLLSMKQSQQHSIVIASCNKPELVGDFSKNIRLYSSNEFTTATNEGVVYFLFKKQKDGFMYFRASKQIKTCVKLAVYRVPANMTANTNIRDFVVSQETSTFSLEKPTGVFRIDCSMHELLKKQPVKSPLNIRLSGLKGGTRTVIQESKVTPVGTVETYDFSYVFNTVSDDFKDLQIEFKSFDKMIMLNSELVTKEIPDVEKGQVTYFSLKKGQKLTYQLIAEPDAKDTEQVKLLPSDKLGLKVSEQLCNAKKGCQFTVEANRDYSVASIYFSGNIQQKKEEEQQVVAFDIDKSVTKKITQGNTQYFWRKFPAGHSFQVVVNSPNVIIWAANQQKCAQPSKACHQKAGNNQHAFIYETTEEATIMFAVKGLDTCEYTMTIMDNEDNYIDLVDSTAFSYQMDEEETEMIFKFKMAEKHDVAFNLIAPLHELNLYVSNTDRKPNLKETDLQSVDGYLFLAKKQLESTTFTVMVVKTKHSEKKYVHFSIIASTSGTNMRLQPSITHYQTLVPKGNREFVFQFDTDQDHIVTFYTHNSKAVQLHLSLRVSNKDNNWDAESVIQFQIDKDSDSLDLKDVSKELCKQQQSTSCEIFLKIINTLDDQIEVAITLMVMDSVIELKDGLWQSYPINSVSSSSHFYFFPRHEDKSVNILYKSSYSQLRMSYSLWKAEDETIDPSEWPFPADSVKKQDQDKTSPYSTYLAFRPTNHIEIRHEVLKECWPSCVILISLLQDKIMSGLEKSVLNTKFSEDKFYILASNNIIQIPERTKLDVIEKENEQKFFLIDIGTALPKGAITIFTSVTIGNVDMFATVYSEVNPRCPSEDDSDFVFGRIQTQIKQSSIQSKLSENDMEKHNDIYLCVLAKAFMDSKFYIEWTSDQDMIKVLELDSFETVPIEKAQKIKYFQVTPRFQDYEIKFTRNRGFPFIKVLTCKGEDDYDQCLEKDDEKTQTKQMVTKTEVFDEPSCDDCIIFIEISSEESAELEIHVQSKNSEVELKQSRVVSDFIEKDQSNRYLIIAVSNEETIININVIEGKVQAEVTDLGSLNIKKSKTGTDNSIHIVIPAVKTKQNTAAPGKPLDDDFAKLIGGMVLGTAYFNQNSLFSTMRYLHLTISSTDPSVSSSYTVTYSSGARQIYLQDGLVTDYTLEPHKETTFYYENVLNRHHAILSLSMDNSSALYKVEMKMNYYDDPNDEDTKEDFTPEKPPMRKNTPEPTVVYALPENKVLYSFSFTNPSDTEQKISLVINHLEVMLLPYDHTFPFQLHQTQTINMLIDVVNTGYLVIEIKKCDESNPEFGYTFSEEQFQKQEYTYSTELTDDPTFTYNVKANQVGTLYLMFKSPETEGSILSIRVTHSAEKAKGSKVKPGNKGILEYQLMNSQEAEITFVGAVCSGQKCTEDITYYTAGATDMPTLYSQMVCPRSYFSTETMISQKPINMTKIQAKADSNNKITFKYNMLEQLSYISVKGVYSGGNEVYYKPIEVVTVWGQLSRTSHSHKFAMLMIGLCGLCGVLICTRRCMRNKDYEKLQETE